LAAIGASITRCPAMLVKAGIFPGDERRSDKLI
jgi:hypothetical protein